ncbi:MAG: MopE-related protein [Planctomycetota bacterium]|jgi:hypothetical protein
MKHALPLSLALAAALLACDDTSTGSSEAVSDDDPDAGRELGGDGGTDTDGSAPDIPDDCVDDGPERCNDIDDDCDGATDEGFGDLGSACSAGEGACAAEGTLACAADGMAAECNAEPAAPGAETCNDIDDDCDGTTDEGADVSSDVENCGACGTVCALENATPACEQAACVVAACADGFVDLDGEAANGCECASAGQELCNGEDDDCDGAVDEEIGVGEGCMAGVGACGAVGTTVCDADGAVVCDAVPGEPADAEICNGIDDDCDGMADEGVDQDSCEVPFARVGSLAIKGNANGCQDLDGDGTPDNVFSAAALLNEQLQGPIDDGQLNLMIGAIGLSAPGLDGVFTAVLLPSGRAPDEPGAFTPLPDAFDMNGEPIVVLPGEAVNGQMTAGPGDFIIPFDVGGPMAELRLVNTRMTGRTSVDVGGLSIDAGLVSGAITQEAFDGVLDILDPGIAGIARALIQPDLDLDADGQNDAYSACAEFEAAAATMVGWP